MSVAVVQIGYQSQRRRCAELDPSFQRFVSQTVT